MAYEVRFTVHVDHPEMRGPTYPAVAAGTKLANTWTYTSYSAAVAEFKAMLAGGYDFGSEYVSKACVVRRHVTKSPTVVRKTVERARRA